MSEPVYDPNVTVEWNGVDSTTEETKRMDGRIMRDEHTIPDVTVIGRGFANPEFMTANDDGIFHSSGGVTTFTPFGEELEFSSDCTTIDHVSAAIANGDVDCTFNVDMPNIAGVAGAVGTMTYATKDYVDFPKVWDPETQTGIEAKTTPIPLATVGIDNVVVHTMPEENLFVAPVEDRGITIEAANPEYGINNCNPDITITTPEVWQEHLKAHVEKEYNEEDKPLTKREMSMAFMLQKDNIKIDIKQELNKALKDYPDRVEFIKNLFNTKVAFKQFKHVNFATKRIVLNNILRGKLLIHSANTNDAVNDILVLLENDNHHSTYLHNLRVALSEIISKGIRLV